MCSNKLWVHTGHFCCWCIQQMIQHLLFVGLVFFSKISLLIWHMLPGVWSTVYRYGGAFLGISQAQERPSPSFWFQSGGGAVLCGRRRKPQAGSETSVPSPSSGCHEKGLKGSLYSTAPSSAFPWAALNRPLHSAQAFVGLGEPHKTSDGTWTVVSACLEMVLLSQRPLSDRPWPGGIPLEEAGKEVETRGDLNTQIFCWGVSKEIK